MTTAADTELPPPDDGVGRATQAFFLLFLAMCLGFGIWAWNAELDIVSVAAGEVKPSSEVKKVQHFEGGIVKRILVEEGDMVRRGEPLVILESTLRGADVEELRVRLAALRIEVLRREAEAAGAKNLQLPPGLVSGHEDLARRARVLFETRRNRYEAEVESQKELIAQRRQRVREIQVRIANTRRSLKLLEEQIAISEELMKDQLTNRYNHLQLLREKSSLQSRLDEDREALQGARAALQEAKARLVQIRHAFREEAREALAKVQRDMDELSQRLRKYEDSLKRTVLRAPVDGVVKNVLVSTVGGVVKAGDTVVELVPADDRLVVEAQLPTQDIGYVRVGQPAIIKLNSRALARFGRLEGRVVRISPDKLIRADGLPYYRVRIAPEKTYFEHGDQKYELFPGTQVIASIRTGRRTVAEYLLGPLVGSMGEAMRER